MTGRVSCGIQNRVSFPGSSILKSIVHKKTFCLPLTTRSRQIRCVKDGNQVVVKQGVKTEELSQFDIEVVDPPMEVSYKTNMGPQISPLSSVGVLALMSLAADPSLANAAESGESKSLPLLPGIGVVEGTVLLAPVLLYTVFSIYRTGFNRDAKLGDFLLLVVSIFIFGNILSTLFLKVRLF